MKDEILNELAKELLVKSEQMECELFADFDDCHDDSTFQELRKKSARADMMKNVATQLIKEGYLNGCE